MSDVYPDNLRYTKEHEWVRIEGKVATVGVTGFAVEQLGDVTMLELPDEGDTVAQDDVFGTVESVKAVSDLFAPLSGKVVKVNTPLNDTPEYVNDDPYDEGWMIQIEITNEAEIDALLDAAAYAELVAEQDG